MTSLQGISVSRRSLLASRFAVLLAILIFAICMPARANLVIQATYDSSITSDPNAATIEATIQNAINLYQNTFTDNITVKIKFQEMTSGLGASSTWLTQLTYTNYLADLTADATTANDTIALAHLPAGPNNPVGGGTAIWASVANARAVGVAIGQGPDGFDGTIGLNTSITNLSRPDSDPNKYDLQSVTMHEIDEVLGLGSGVGSQFTIRPEDLYRYTAAGVRTYTTAGDDAYFSIDGTTDLARFNQNSGGDYGDWWSTGPHTAQVQDAFGTPGAETNPNVELTALDVVGYDQAAETRVPEPSSLMLLGSGLAGFAGLVRRKLSK